MKSRFALIFCLFAISATEIASQATLYSSSSTAQTFSRCVVDRLCQSQVFDSDERSSMVGVADVMAQGLKSLDSGNRGPVSVKILLKAFVTSLADIVTHGDGSRTSLRQNAYSTAVEQCSLSTISRVDIETISESLRILYSLEDSQIAGVLEEVAPAGRVETDGIPPRNPVPPAGPGFPPVMPSPVQSPFMPTYFDRYSETAFKPSGNPFNFQLSPSPAHSSLVGPPPLRFPSFGASSSLSQAGSYASTAFSGSGGYSSFVDTHIAPSFGFGAFNLPQTKSSAVYPQRASQAGMIAPFQQLPAPPNIFDQYPLQPSGNMGSPLSFDGSPIRDTTFMGIKVSPGQSFQTRPSGYIPYDVGGLRIPPMKESSVRVQPPLIQALRSDDALPQAPSLPENLHLTSTSEIPLPQNVNSFVTTTPASMPEMDKENKNFPVDSTLETIIFRILTNSTNFREAFDFGINPQNALNLAHIITEQSLTGYDTNIIRQALNAVSDAVSRVTVGSPDSYAVALSDALVHVLKAHNLPLFVDGSKVATSMLSNLDTLMQMPPEYSSEEQSEEFISPGDFIEGQETQLPFDYQFPATTPEYNCADTFSRALTEYILQSNELADFFCQKDFPQNRMKIYFSFIKFSLADFGPQVSSIAASITSGNLLHLPDEVLCSSYAQTISVTIADILDENDLLPQAKAESIADKMSFSLLQQLAIPTQVPVKGDSTSGQSSVNLPQITTPVIQTSFTNNFDNSYQETSALPDIYNHPSTYPMTSSEATSYKTDYATSAIENTSKKTTSPSMNLTSSPIQKSSTEAVTQSYSSPYTSGIEAALMYSLIPSPVTETSSTAEDKIPAISGDKIDKEKLSSFLSKEMESVVSAINDESFEKDKSADEAVGTETKDIPESDDSQLTEKPQDGENPDPDSTSTPDVHVVKVRSFRHHSGSSQSIEHSVTTENAYSEISSTEYPSDLKPSFQNSRTSNKKLATSERLAHTSDLLVSRYNESRYIYAKAISQLAANLITFLKSKHFNLLQLCSKLNLLAPVLNIPPLDYCGEYAVIDYLLHVLQSMGKLIMDV